ncbi:MAG: DUF2202 domain-containing protein [Petrotogaceae bacterium]|jgi:hypothetical protein|nr:DUF2202 domain-containing protein [Petrotogaceae bacterium]HPX15495.1 DUF2202 domain-containing protein [Petrotogaceae bacterium]HQC41714.1 DUF2202 domain-containing protein [Petrotogaceae bacterium]
MKKVLLMAGVLSAVIFSFAQGPQGMGNRNIPANRQADKGYSSQRDLIQDQMLKNYVGLFAFQTVDETEKTALLKMVEEEKLARDVYIALAEKWDINPFINIAKAEQVHMLQVQALLEKYKIDYVAQEEGKFSSHDVQELYNQLVQQGSTSQIEAFKVGMLIEEMDIADINSEIVKVDNEDIKQIFVNLRQGSENHLMAFNRQLLINNEKYQPKYLTQVDIEKILGR